MNRILPEEKPAASRWATEGDREGDEAAAHGKTLSTEGLKWRIRIIYPADTDGNGIKSSS